MGVLTKYNREISTKVERATLVPLAPDLPLARLPSSGPVLQGSKEDWQMPSAPSILEEGVCGFY